MPAPVRSRSVLIISVVVAIGLSPLYIFLQMESIFQEENGIRTTACGARAVVHN
jgi:hypothetical protein